MADLRAWRDELTDRGAEIAAIVGHSLGGLWALAASEELDAEALALVATPVSIRAELGALERLFYRVGAGLHRLASPLGIQLRVPNQIGLDEVLASEEAIATARSIDLLQGSIPLANAGDLLALDGRALAQTTTAPTIVAHPRADELVAEASLGQLYEALAGPRSWLELPGPHECFFDREGTQAAEVLADELDAVLAGPEPAT
jgi:pimeloyl-ACP methyl ester carboxylesterase